MKPSYKIALAVCAVILTGSMFYWASKKFGKKTPASDANTQVLADNNTGAAPANPSDLTAPLPPAGTSGAPSASPAAPSSPATPPAGLIAPPATTDTAAAPAAPATPALSVAPQSAPPAPAAPAAAPTPPPAAPAVAAKPAEAPAPAPKPAAKHATSGKTYAVRSGDTLSSISQKFFGDHKHADEIYKANRKTIGSNPNSLKVGEKLDIPAK